MYFFPVYIEDGTTNKKVCFNGRKKNIKDLYLNIFTIFFSNAN